MAGHSVGGRGRGAISNIPVWEELLGEIECPERELRWVYVLGHAGMEGNKTAHHLSLEGMSLIGIWATHMFCNGAGRATPAHGAGNTCTQWNIHRNRRGTARRSRKQFWYKDTWRLNYSARIWAPSGFRGASSK